MVLRLMCKHVFYESLVRLCTLLECNVGEKNSSDLDVPCQSVIVDIISPLLTLKREVFIKIFSN